MGIIHRNDEEFEGWPTPNIPTPEQQKEVDLIMENCLDLLVKSVKLSSEGAL